jgi:hypothetical protein
MEDEKEEKKTKYEESFFCGFWTKFYFSFVFLVSVMFDKRYF